MSHTVVVGAVAHETNTFVETPVTRADFRARYEHLGDEASALAGTETQMGGVLDAAEGASEDTGGAGRTGVDLVHTVAAAATPGGVVADDTFAFYADRILAGVREHRDALDGVMLPLHGAMVTASITDGEGELVDRVREVVGPDVPIVVTLDLHANVSERLVRTADAVLTYETYPHLDKAATGRRGLAILRRAMAGDVDPVTRRERVPTIVFQPTARTDEGPMAELQALAREAETRDGVLKASVAPGFYHADVPEMGVTTTVVTDGDPELAAAVARELGVALWRRRESFVADYPGPTEAVDRAEAAVAERGPDAGPVVLADFGSNPGGGGAADGTTILREFIDRGLTGAGWAIMYDPEALADCLDTGVAERVTTSIGGKTDDRHGATIEGVDGYVKAITDGRYVNTGTSHSGKGVQNDLGPTVRLECGPDDGVTVVLSGTRASAFDAEIWRHVGQPPERLDYLCVPSLIAFLGDYGPMASEVILVDTPGASAVDPARFEYERIPRPIYPLDDLPPAAYPRDA